MPELPEVETTCQGIAPEIIGQRITRIIVRQHKLRRLVPIELTHQCSGATIQAVSRRAKYILIHLHQGTLLIHLGMSGHLRMVPGSTPPNPHDHIDLILTNNRILRYTDPRRFGVWDYCPHDGFAHPLLSNLGPEPLDDQTFTPEYLFQNSRKRQVAIKNHIMNSKIVVGVGNIYASESLFDAKIHPAKPAGTLNQKEAYRLCISIKKILKQAIIAGGTTLKDFLNPDGKPGYFSQTLKVYGQHKQPCLQCSTMISTVKIGGRSSYFCPHCQADCPEAIEPF